MASGAVDSAYTRGTHVESGYCKRRYTEPPTATRRIVSGLGCGAWGHRAWRILTRSQERILQAYGELCLPFHCELYRALTRSVRNSSAESIGTAR
jgi:hypothetical protein